MKIDSRNPAALGMLVVGIVLMAATLVYSLLVKAPDPKAAIAAQSKQILNSRLEAKKSEDKTATELASTQMRLWSDSDDVIAPKTLKILTDLAEKHGLKVSSFRPQKELSAGALTILPFFVSVDGPFPATGEFIQEFEENQQSLIVTNVQIASSDQNTHSVTASIEVCAYIDPNRDAGKATIAAKTPAANGAAGAKAAVGAKPATGSGKAAAKPPSASSTKSEVHSARELSRAPSKA